jgi:indolepyruvate ferredoxin oxidoreductase, beta subunit
MKLDFLLAGVGGQGILLASDLIAEAGMEAGLDVKKSDIHGMAQRGGSVVSYVRLASKVWSPLPKKGDSDYLLALEMLEGARWASYLKPGGTAVLSRDYIFPPSVRAGTEPYPSDLEVEQELRKRTEHVYLLDGPQLAQEVGNPRTVNVLMVGFLSYFLPFEAELWERVVEQRVPTRFLELNLKAFRLGREEAEWASKRQETA